MRRGVRHRVGDSQIEPARAGRQVGGNLQDVAGEVVAPGGAAGFLQRLKSPLMKSAAIVGHELERGVNPGGMALRRLVAGEILEFEIDDQLLPWLEASAVEAIDGSPAPDSRGKAGIDDRKMRRGWRLSGWRRLGRQRRLLFGGRLSCRFAGGCCGGLRLSR